MVRAGVIAPLVVAAALSCSATARAQAPSADDRITAPAAFRLGTAARPYGWSTAIGDLNADGRPDAAITDRVGRLGGGFAYSLELKLAGVGSRSLTFDAPEDALAIALLDIDHDHDLDVVVSAPISRAVVRVWLNDGQGGFHEAAPPPRNAALGDASADGGVPGATGLRAVVLSPRWQHVARAGDARAGAAFLCDNRLTVHQPMALRGLAAASIQSRAPPRI
jgi:hypothetical protein